MPVGSELIPSRSLPQATPSSPVTMRLPRGGQYGEAYTIPIFNNAMGASDEGSYFVATTPTPGTGVAFGGAAITAFNDTTGAGLVLINGDVPSQTAKRLYLDYIKLILTVIPTSATNIQLAVKLDNVQSRYTSGGSVITPVNPNGDVGAASVARVAFGALTLAASSSAARILGRAPVRTIAPLVNDKYLLTFGSLPDVASQNYALATAGAFTAGFPPIIIGPNQVLSVHSWGTAQAAAPSFELEMGWIER